jgi:hypothetical protein
MNGTCGEAFCTYCRGSGHCKEECALKLFDVLGHTFGKKQEMSAYEQAAQAATPYPGDCAMDHSYFSDCPTVHPDVTWGSFWSSEQTMQDSEQWADMQGPEGWYSGYDEEC